MANDTSFIQRALSRSFLYGANSLLSKAIGFIMLPIYTRYLSPADYGIASFLLLYVSLVQVVLGVKLESAISKFHYDKTVNSNLNQIISTANALTAIACIIPVAGSILFADYISLILFSTTDHSLLVAILSGSILFGTLELYNMQYIRIRDKAAIYVAISVSGLLIQVAINIIIIVVLNMGVIGVIISNVIASGFKWLVSGLYMISQEGMPIFNKTLVKPLVVFSAPLWLSGILGLYAGSAHQIFINYFGSLSDLGLYNVGATLGLLIGTFAFGPFWSFWQVERFKIQHEKKALQKYRHIFIGLLIIGVVMSIGISTFAIPVIIVMADSAFHPAYFVVSLLCVSTTYTYLATYAGFSFLISNNNGEIARASFFNAIATTIFLLILVPEFGFIGAAIAVMFGSMFNFYYVTFRAKRFFDMGIPVVMTTITLTATTLIGISTTLVYKASPSLLVYTIGGAVFNLALCITAVLYAKRKYPDFYIQLTNKLPFLGNTR
jgi:O-antigen/teichoic acid export membrane protein